MRTFRKHFAAITIAATLGFFLLDKPINRRARAGLQSLIGSAIRIISGTVRLSRV